MNSSHVAADELPVKDDIDRDNGVTFKLLEPAQDLAFEVNDAEESDPEDYRPVTEAYILRKSGKKQSNYGNTSHLGKYESEEKAKLVAEKEVTFNL